MTTDDLKWQAEDDARVILRYAELMADKIRFDAAKAFLENEAEMIDAAIKGFKDGGA